MNPPQPPSDNPPDYISIPEHLKSKPIGAPHARLVVGPRLAARLIHLLEDAGVRVLGDLDGKRLSDFEQRRTCGAGTIWALRRMILRALYPGDKFDLSTRPIPMRYWWPPDHTIEVPQAAVDLRIRDLPVSARLAGVLKEMSIERLGQLHGLPIVKLLVRPNCGPKTLADMKALLGRAETGEFMFSERELASKTPADLLRLIDDIVRRLPERPGEFLALYFGATGEAPRTLSQIGHQYGITGSRVGQQLSHTIEWIRREGNPRLLALLHLVEGVCTRRQTSLDSEMISTLQDSEHPFRYSPQFYVRLIHRLRSEIDAISVGQVSVLTTDTLTAPVNGSVPGF